MQHEPCRFLSYPKCAVNLIGTDAVLAINEQPCRAQPLLQWNRRVFKYRASLERERWTLVLGIALPYALPFEISNLFCATSRAGYFSIWPTQLDHKLAAMLEIREPNDCSSESLRRFHDSNIG